MAGIKGGGYKYRIKSSKCLPYNEARSRGNAERKAGGREEVTKKLVLLSSLLPLVESMAIIFNIKET